MDGGGPKNYETIEALGKSIYEKVKFDVPPLSVTYVLVSGDSIPVITGIKNIEKPDLKIYPNPTSGEITIYSHGFKYDKLEIFNLTGRMVVQRVLNQPPSELVSFNFNLNSGIYILALYNGTQQISRKLVVK